MFLEKVAKVFDLDINSGEVFLTAYFIRHFGMVKIEVDALDKFSEYTNLDLNNSLLGKLLYYVNSYLDLDLFCYLNEDALQFFSDLLSISIQDFKLKVNQVIDNIGKELDLGFEDLDF